MILFFLALEQKKILSSPPTFIVTLHNACLTAEWITVGRKTIRALAIILATYSGLIPKFYNLMLAINSIKNKDDDLTNIYIIRLH